MATIAARPLTAAEYLLLPDTGRPTELVRGEVVPMNLPSPRHGEICCQVAYLLRRCLDDHPTGRVVTNDAGVITEHDPDTVRGPDVAYYGFQRVPQGPLPRGYLAVAPELAFEVRSRTDRWADLHAKVAEYLRAGVLLVGVLDEATEAIHVFSPEDSPRVVAGDQELTFPGLLEHFRVPARRFFE